MPIMKKHSKQMDVKKESDDKAPAKNLAAAYSAKAAASKKKGMPMPKDAMPEDAASPKQSMIEAIMGKRQMMADGGISYVNRPNNGYGAIIFKAEGGKVENNPSAMSMDNVKKAFAPAPKPTATPNPELVEKVKKYGFDRLMAEGGMVDDTEEMEDIAPGDAFEKLNEKALLKENYDESDLEDFPQPEDSNEHGMDEDDKQDMISAIRSRIHAKRLFR